MPIAANTEISTHKIIEPIVNSKPALCITKSEVIRIKATQPFILTIVQIGSTNLDILGLILRLFSAQSNVTGRVPAELFVKNAVIRAESIFLNVIKVNFQ